MLRTPRRTLMTTLGIGAVVTIVIALAGLMDSFAQTLTASRQEALAGAPNRMTVDLVRLQRADSALVRRITGAGTVGAAQPSLRVSATLLARGERVQVALEAVPDHRPLWHPTVAAGAFAAGRPGLLIARPAAEQLGVAVGDPLTLEHPLPTAHDTFRLARSTLTVTGIHASPMRFVAYSNAPATARLGLGGLVNRLSITPAPGRDDGDVKAQLLQVPGVGAVQGATAVTDAVERRMEQFNQILLVTVAIAAAMALLIAFNATAINTDERAREHATMFAHGVTVNRVTRGTVVESLLIGALGTVVGIAGGRALLTWMVHTNLPETMPDIGMLIAVTPATSALAVAAGILVPAAAPLLTFRRLRRADIPAALRVVE